MADPAPATPPAVRIGTRQSILAKIQAEGVRASLSALHPARSFAVDAMRTLGDRDKVTALYSFEGKNLWTSELEAKLRAGEIDVIVHCLKDMPTTLPEDCELAVIPARDDPRDALVVRTDLQSSITSVSGLPAGSVVGTSSVRRAAQLRRRHPHLRFANLRGNVDTRLATIDHSSPSEYACMIMSAAGLERMGGLPGHARGGCTVPVGVETAWLPGERLRLGAIVVSLDGQTAVEDVLERTVATEEEAEALGYDLAELLVKAGAQDILREVIANRLPKEQQPVDVTAN
ncbi:porphobilinogen deaminase [Cordyceps fumosorosea ARSEF 2679]|uniref:Porphobilinogen deaminase n=1 Tax=Cordyceps fumosorosea (strain ARSEF 2679) TaxID=1081104 RepID=A0A162JQ30_CORFA|nr:porphobilinogen deaminase [Cordyceps fumosorosea ARSEF 2679]OAA72102.1 porphobilinogen deaminase [Cordyceps fumosorosea ARSEF 2679]